MASSLIHEHRVLAVRPPSAIALTTAPARLRARRIAALHHFATPAVRELPRRDRTRLGDSAW